MPQLGMSELDEIFGLLPGGSGVSEMLLEQAKASSLFHLLSQWRFATEHWEEDLLSQPLWRGRYRVSRWPSQVLIFRRVLLPTELHQ